MNILLTGSTGYVGKRLIPILLGQGHRLICCVRDANRFPLDKYESSGGISLIEIDFLGSDTLFSFPAELDAAFYLMHSMTSTIGDFESLEEQMALRFVNLIRGTQVRQIIYLGGIANEESLSPHLRSRKRTEEILRTAGIPTTVLRAGIIVGSGSASFEIIRDLVEKLPVMVAPRWLNTPHQPIAITNVLGYLAGVIGRVETFHQTYDIGGPDVVTYKQMLLGYAEVRGLRRVILTLPVMTPRLSSYWLYFVTATSYKLAINLVNSMKIRVVARPNGLAGLLGITPISYREAVGMALEQIGKNQVISSWKDALVASPRAYMLSDYTTVPEQGCFTDRREMKITGDAGRIISRIWSIGGDRGWYYGDALWRIRGILDKLSGGVGLRRGRTNQNDIRAGDALDFWRVVLADREAGRLLLFAEMKLPGEAWLEFVVVKKNGESFLRQTATFRPRGLLGRLYWYTVLPFHHYVFGGMLKGIVSGGDVPL